MRRTFSTDPPTGSERAGVHAGLQAKSIAFRAGWVNGCGLMAEPVKLAPAVSIEQNEALAIQSKL
jgi:hypothetical protein